VTRLTRPNRICIVLPATAALLILTDGVDNERRNPRSRHTRRGRTGCRRLRHRLIQWSSW
jgi:hypothetical protein